ncbi:RluA family pseudouridine synthase [Williamwhitmania taraxaci]|uniref:Ribosomal large subunit pseudouridine synthase D n=1 Tax=Williamwhitmania taraxaci TaxID=1640674 RepID=A0A1G6GQ03_9BACT|nr:RNA pseudouridine synthase [Williamwhitmania taraxaci]SDB84090.1 ribosomal large subunit pseudouridine synthase D [Williamwhitmania taraxaci]
MAFTEADILWEDNHLLAVNKHAGQLVQVDTTGDSSLEDEVKAFLKKRESKPGNVFLGVTHRIDRPVSGVVLFAKTSKALTRINEMFREGTVKKTYWAIVKNKPEEESATLEHYLVRDTAKNRTMALTKPRADAKVASLSYTILARSVNYFLLEIDLHTGRHHQIRAQLAKIGCPIKGDLKYGFARSNPDGGICLHSREISIEHPVKNELVVIVAPTPKDVLWIDFVNSLGGKSNKR